jgi:hypothetical protein
MALIWPICSMSGMAQDTTFLGQFQAMESQGRIRLSWVVNQGNICDGMEIERGVDGGDFQKIGQIDGMCGSLERPQTYEFWDETPVFNRVSHYRLKTFGAVVSDTLEVELVDAGNKGFLVVPHPATSDSRIYLENTRFETCQILVVGMDGRPARERIFRGERLDVGELDLLPGIYAIKVQTSAGFVFASGLITVR